MKRSYDTKLGGENQHEIYKAKGGICFDLDVN